MFRIRLINSLVRILRVSANIYCAFLRKECSKQKSKYSQNACFTKKYTKIKRSCLYYAGSFCCPIKPDKANFMSSTEQDLSLIQKGLSSPHWLAGALQELSYIMTDPSHFSINPQIYIHTRMAYLSSEISFDFPRYS